MDPIKTLILSGTNNHDWQLSTPLLWLAMRQTKRFEIDVTTNPSATLEDAEFVNGFDLIFVDYNGPDWSALAQKNFEAAVESGIGLLILHAANNPFKGWVEYEKMAALLWREGTGHGFFHEFPVTITDHDHPITRGVEDFRITDELYHRLVHLHDAPYHVLATGYSSTESKGTGNDEPVMITTQWGEGRVFHMILGHVWSDGDLTALNNKSFQTCLLRGCEWAATGDVED